MSTSTYSLDLRERVIAFVKADNVSVKDKSGSLSVIAVLPATLKETVKTFLELIPHSTTGI